MPSRTYTIDAPAALLLASVLCFGAATNEARADATVTYRDGLDGYAGTRAVAISSLGLTASGYGMNGTTFLDGGDWCIGDLPNSLGYDISPLVRFDGLAPVAAEHVASATLHVRAEYWGTGPARVVVRYLAVPWATTFASGDGAGVGWRTRMAGVPWATLGAEGEGDDVLASKTATSALLAQGQQTLAIALDPAVVQGWIDDPPSNHGVVLRVDVPNQHVGFVPPLSNKELDRPTLVLEFLPGPSPDPIPVDAGTSTTPPEAHPGGCAVRPVSGPAGAFAPALLALAALRASLRLRGRRTRRCTLSSTR